MRILLILLVFFLFLDKICYNISTMLMEWSALVNMMMDGTWIIMNHGPYLLRMILGDLKINTKSSFYEDESASHSR